MITNWQLPSPSSNPEDSTQESSSQSSDGAGRETVSCPEPANTRIEIAFEKLHGKKSSIPLPLPDMMQLFRDSIHAAAAAVSQKAPSERLAEHFPELKDQLRRLPEMVCADIIDTMVDPRTNASSATALQLLFLRYDVCLG